MKGMLMISENQVATREKRKTQTRRLDHLAQVNEMPELWNLHELNKEIGHALFWHQYKDLELEVPSRYKVEETVYIKEAWTIKSFTPNYADENQLLVVYKSDYLQRWINVDYNTWSKYSQQKYYAWQSPLFLPEIFARDFIKVTDLGIDRLQNITEEDAKAEGAECVIWHGEYAFQYENQMPIATYKAGFANLWDSINGKTYPWESNVWVWIYTYEYKQSNL